MPHATLVDLLRGRADAQGSRTALTFLEDGEDKQRSVTYGELDQRARAIAAAMVAAGIQSGERALLLYPPGIDYVTAFLGCLYAGVVAVPAYPPDPRRLGRTLPRLRGLIQDSGATVALAEPFIHGLLDAAKALPAEIPAQRWLSTGALAAADAHLAWQRPALGGSSLAFLQYTSGSTGAPKGVMLSHDNLLANSAFIQRNFGTHGDSVAVIWLPPYHDMGLIGGILHPLCTGFPTVLLSPLDFLARPVRWLRAVMRHGGTVSGGPNFAFDLCARKITDEEAAGLDLATWTVAFNGAEPIRPATLARFSQRFAAQGFRPDAFHPCYGLAEATLLVTGRTAGAAATVRPVSRDALARGRAAPPRGDGDTVELAGSGHGIDGEDIAIVDAERRVALRDGELGEIWVAGPHVAAGYWARPDDTERTFRARLADGRGPFLRTGDLGFVASGELFIAGRIKDLMIVRGRNLYPQDLELSVEHSHRAIRPGCVAAVASVVDDEERVAIVAEVNVNTANLDDVLAQARLALVKDHEVAPAAVVLVRPGSIPKTSSGKLQRSACGDALRSGQLDVVAEWRPARTVAHDDADWPALRLAMDETDAWLLERVAMLSGQWPPQTLDREAPIAAYLDSLQSLELQHAIETRFARALPYTRLLAATSLGEVAAALRSGAPAGECALPAPGSAAIAPLSHGQRALWMMERLAPDGIYSIAGAARIHGRLDIAALERAMARLVARQPALRTVLDVAGDEPRQRILDTVPVTIEIFDAEHEPSQRELTDAANRGFALDRGPLFRLQLWRSGGDARVLLLVLHHLIADLWSITVLLNELAHSYVQEIGGPAAELAPLATDHAAYVRAQASALDGPRGAALREFWHRQLAQPFDPVALPIDKPRPREFNFRGAAVAFELDPTLAAALRRLAAAEGATLYETLLSAYFVLLHRYTGQSDLIVGSPTTGRTRSELRDLVGYFVNLVPVRGDLTGNPSFRELVHRVRRTTADTFAHADLPFPLLVEWVAPPRDPSRPILVQASFMLQKAHIGHERELAEFAIQRPGARLPFGPLVLESLGLETRAIPTELELYIADTGCGLSGRFQYNPDLLTEGAIERLIGHFQTLLGHLVAAPDRRIAGVPLVTDAELAALAPAVKPAPWLGRTAVEVFAERATTRADAVALTQDGHHLTYAELDARASQLAHLLRANGIGRAQVVGVALDRSFEMVIALLGIVKAGAAYLCLDLNYPDERIGLMLADSRPGQVLTHSKDRARLAALGARWLCLDEQADALAAQPRTGPDVAISPDDLFYVMYTSGSTGRPKGIAVHHQSIVASVLADDNFPPADELVTLAHSAMSWDAPIHEIWGALLHGGRCVLYPARTVMELDRLAELGRRERISALLLTPALFHTAVDVAPEALPQVKYLLVGGDAVSVSHMRRGAMALPATRIINGYGPAETTIVATRHVVSAAPEVDAPSVPIGRDCADKVTYLLDAQLNLVPVGLVGEIYIGGPSVARGYIHNPGLTAERFVPDLLSGRPGARMYRTGDLARRRADGVLEFVGRSDHQVKLRGVRIELGEIETALEALPAVRDAAVVLSGELGTERSLIAYVVPHDAQRFDAAQIRRELAERLPAVMVPGHVVALEALPLTPNAKVDRRWLATLPPPTRSVDGAMSTTTETERELAEIWCSLLNLAHVGPLTNFFKEGGNSLLLARMSARIRETFDTDLPLAALFQSETLAELARAIDECKGQAQPTRRSLPPLRKASRDGVMLDSSAKKSP